MSSRSPVALFLAASAILAANTMPPNGEVLAQSSERGRWKEWTTDQDVDAESTLDDDAKKARKKAEEEDICIPIGEGENCW